MICEQGHRMYDKTLSSIRSGKGCQKCFDLRRGDTQRLSVEDYHALAKLRGFTFSSDNIKGVFDDVFWKCRYGHTWSARYNNVRCNETGCPRCYEKDRQSKNERKLCNWLASLDKSICSHYEHPKKFVNLIDKKQLSYDAFAHFVEDAMRMTFETDGIQHYEPVDFFGGQERFEIQRRHDILKEEYCIRNKIHLIRIRI